ncbi:MAG: SDR family NAD(P)-dependent oxidoreductase [Pseudomonas sp.]|uniref:SDR family NAD(P)-dependent oxidoreductase n=1 Tax=Pseudomonas sp. TaxID=306 RepID=UPI0012079B10|nr:SDR family NAD(P)-dependent oxidoreductase [Pseudomonas sp.]RZI72061.1 MAG: SDR family NAD(P)-dependent oxidoreductase [Pseudomonas sp.]
MPDRLPVVLVTGASRGAGKGIAIALGAHGCTVYVTGRSNVSGDHPLHGTISETADAVTQAGGKGVAVVCDHSDDTQVAALFAQIEAEQGRLDVLVNNAAAVHDELTMPGNFWEKPLKLADMIDVGIPSSYVASRYAAPIMAKQDKALIVFTSASGAVHYSLGAAYGAHKASLDKMAHDMTVDFAHAECKVASVSIWMGAVLTERLKMVIASDREKFGGLEGISENPGFTGDLIWGLFNDPELIEKSGKTFIGAELAQEYGVNDQGRQPPSYRQTQGAAPFAYLPTIIR